MDMDLNVPISLSNVAIQETYEGNMLDRRIIASSFNFTCKTRVYAPIRENVPISTAQLNFGNILGDTNNVLYSGGITGNTLDFTIGDFIYE